jgi:hypothetical protein
MLHGRKRNGQRRAGLRPDDGIREDSMKKQLTRFWNEERSLTALLTMLIIEMFIIIPTSRVGYALELLGGFAFSLLLLAGLLSMVRHKIFQTISGVFVLCTMVVRLARVVFDVSGLLPWDFLLSTASISCMVIVVLWQVYRDGPVTGHRVRGAIAAYLLIGFLFAFNYTLIDYLLPGSFQLPAWVSQSGSARSEAFLYFSMVSLTTAGYGDIAPIHPMARSLVMVETLIGQLYPAILIARLVTLEIETRRSKKK